MSLTATHPSATNPGGVLIDIYSGVATKTGATSSSTSDVYGDLEVATDTTTGDGRQLTSTC